MFEHPFMKFNSKQTSELTETNNQTWNNYLKVIQIFVLCGNRTSGTQRSSQLLRHSAHNAV